MLVITPTSNKSDVGGGGGGGGGGELSELLVAEGYWITVGAKPSHVVDETFCSIPTYGANCCYLDRLTFEASDARCKPVKQKEGPTAVY